MRRSRTPRWTAACDPRACSRSKRPSRYVYSRLSVHPSSIVLSLSNAPHDDTEHRIESNRLYAVRPGRSYTEGRVAERPASSLDHGPIAAMPRTSIPLLVCLPPRSLVDCRRLRAITALAHNPCLPANLSIDRSMSRLAGCRASSWHRRCSRVCISISN